MEWREKRKDKKKRKEKKRIERTVVKVAPSEIARRESNLPPPVAFFFPRVLPQSLKKKKSIGQPGSFSLTLNEVQTSTTKKKKTFVRPERHKHTKKPTLKKKMFSSEYYHGEREILEERPVVVGGYIGRVGRWFKKTKRNNTRG
jgi:hypothetical protein